MDDYNRGSHSVYKLTYHIIFVTKYRKKVITDEIGDFLKDMAEYLCNRMNCTLISAETDEDHIHMLVSMPPDIAPVKLVNMVKTQLSKEVRAAYTEHVENICGRIHFGAQVISVLLPGPYPWRQSGLILKGNVLMSTNENTLNPVSTERRFIPQPTHVGRGFLASIFIKMP